MTEAFGALNNGPAIRNVLDFSLQDYYGGFSDLMSGLSVSSATSPKPADPEPPAKTHSEQTRASLVCSRGRAVMRLFLVSVAVSAMFLDTGDAGCCSSEKKSPDAGKSEFRDVDSYVPNTYSRKVFIGGLPPDLDAGALAWACAVCVCVGGGGGGTQHCVSMLPDSLHHLCR